MEMSGGCPTYYKRMIWFCVANLKSLRELVERFGTVCKTRGLKVNVDKSKVMVVSEDTLQCEVMLDGEQLGQVSEFKYLGYMLDEKGTDDTESYEWYRKVAGAIKSLVDVKGLSLECYRVLHEGMLLPVLMYSSETMVWNKRYRSKSQSAQMDNLRGVLGVKRIDKMRNEPVSYTHLRAHETPEHLVCRLLLEKKKIKEQHEK